MSVSSHTGNVMVIMTVEMTPMKNFTFAVREKKHIKMKNMHNKISNYNRENN